MRRGGLRAGRAWHDSAGGAARVPVRQPGEVLDLDQPELLQGHRGRARGAQGGDALAERLSLFLRSRSLFASNGFVFTLLKSLASLRARGSMGLFLRSGHRFRANVKIENSALTGIIWLRFVIPIITRLAPNGFVSRLAFGFVWYFYERSSLDLSPDSQSIC